jgi:hypothetical protein
MDTISIVLGFIIGYIAGVNEETVKKYYIKFTRGNNENKKRS